MLCDVLVVAGDIEISAHRAVLASCSPYFYAMFTGELTESKADRVVLQEIDGRALTLLVDFIYTAEVSVTEDNVQVGTCLDRALLTYLLTYLLTIVRQCMSVHHFKVALKTHLFTAYYF